MSFRAFYRQCIPLKRNPFLGTRRPLTAKANKSVEGTDLVLFDCKPRWWARWAYGLLLVDVIVTVQTCDMVWNHWTERVEKTGPVSVASKGQDSTKKNEATEYEWVLRPGWQRFGLSVLQLVVGAGVGAAILASRESTVWRMRIFRSPRSLTPRLPPAPARQAQNPKNTQKPPPTSIPVLELSTGSGRVKSFLLQNCTLHSGRDSTELILRILGIKGHFWIGLNGSRVLNVAEHAQDMPSTELRKRILERWQQEGGHVLDLRPEKGGVGWSSGPVTR